MRLARERANRPAPTSSSTESATWPTTSAFPSDRRDPGADTLDAPSLSVVFRLTRVARKAGTRPNSDTGQDRERDGEPEEAGIGPRCAAGWALDRTRPAGPARAPTSRRERRRGHRPASRAARLSVRNCRTSRDRRAPRAQAQADFLLPCGGARQQEVRDVRARDEQDQSHHRHEHDQRLGESVAQERRAAGS